MEYIEIIKKSKFLAFGFNIESEDFFVEYLARLKKEHKKATHFCYAYTLNTNGVLKEKFSDDGEPGGTAGRPMLNILKLKNKSNYAVIVVRYFGGIKLGAGGLTRAYIKTASKVIE